jgi:hypothetical protein
MAARKSTFLVGVALAAVLGIGVVSLLLTARGAPEPPRAAGAADAGGDAARAPAGGAAGAASSSPLGPAAGAGAPGAPEPGAPPAAAWPAPASPDDGPDGAAWRKARVAFQVRELGRMGPYVKTALDAARRDMAFCFRRAARAEAGAPAPEGDAAAARGQPAVLLLYLEAREGTLDVVYTRTDYPGDTPPAVVECCREVLGGLEIRAFGAVPGRRYRLKFRLE